jgi:hypothetical protein
VTVAEDIIAARDVGWVDCGLSSLASPSLLELAEEFGLFQDLAIYREIHVDEACRLVHFLLHQGLAYSTQIMPSAKAAELADRFLSQFGFVGTRYYTNGRFHEPQSGGWCSATDSTFDTGLLVIGPTCSGCLWVEDED